LQVHAADPAAPAQVWRTPHATGSPYAKQPFAAVAHVASPPDTQAVCPLMHESVHVAEQATFGASPAHACVAAHVAVALTNGQLSESTAHVATV